MGSQIIKVSRERDLYMQWSSVVDAPTALGTRNDMVTYLDETSDIRWEEKRAADIAERLNRADETGTSSRFVPFAVGWNDKGLIFQQRGWLPRGQFEAFADRVRANESISLDKIDFSDLLEPFENT